jgi:hypothetical protein
MTEKIPEKVVVVGAGKFGHRFDDEQVPGDAAGRIEKDLVGAEE